MSFRVILINFFLAIRKYTAIAKKEVFLDKMHCKSQIILRCFCKGYLRWRDNFRSNSRNLKHPAKAGSVELGASCYGQHGYTVENKEVNHPEIVLLFWHAIGLS